MERRVFIGRFQPAHLGHVHIIEEMLDSFDGELIIVVAAAQHSHKGANPFTAGERIEMLRAALSEAKVDMNRVMVLPAQDINDHALWPYHIMRLVPTFSAIYSNNPLVGLLFERAGVEVLTVPLWKREKYSSSLIRKLLAKQDSGWRDLVPKSIERILDQINAEDRLLRLNSSDEDLSSSSYNPHA